MRPAAAALCLVPATVGAQAALPDFATCNDLEIARFERDLKYLRAGPEADSFEVGSTRGTDYCGTVGITRCDMSEDRVPCQQALAAEQDALRARVVALLPEAGEVRGRAGEDSDALYPALLAMAQDRSTGDDCAGTTLAAGASCAAREANRRLASAILAWQMARFLDAAPDAVTAGWARVPPPTRPRARPRARQE